MQCFTRCRKKIHILACRLFCAAGGSAKNARRPNANEKNTFEARVAVQQSTIHRVGGREQIHRFHRCSLSAVGHMIIDEIQASNSALSSPDSVAAPLCRGTSRRRRQSDVARILTSDGTPGDLLSLPRKLRDRLRKVFPQHLKFLRRSRGHQSTPQLWPREKRNLLSVSAAIILSHTRL